MKIDVLNGTCCFESISAGETFYYAPSGTMWIKLDEPLFDAYKNLYNAVALDDGIPTHFADDDMVVVIPTKLVNA